MNVDEFVYKQTLKGCLDAGLSQSVSASTASNAVGLYKKNKFNQKSVSKMIAELVKEQKRISK